MQKKHRILKILLIILFNVILLFLAFITINYLIYRNYANLWKNENNFANKYILFPAPDSFKMINYDKHFFDGGKQKGRPPIGLEYTKKTPIIIFGCSYALGVYLKDEENFSGKLSNLLKRAVYNRAVCGAGFQQMYVQTISNDLYETIPYTDTVIYVMIQDHYRRMKTDFFHILNPTMDNFYTVKNNKIVMKKIDNKIMNFFKYSYVSRYFNEIETDKYIKNKKNADKLTDEVLLYFTESKKELQKHYGKDIRFIVFLYDRPIIQYSDILKNKLEENGFIVISTNDLTQENMNDHKYNLASDNYRHPSEAAWDLLTPLFIQKAGLEKAD